MVWGHINWAKHTERQMSKVEGYKQVNQDIVGWGDSKGRRRCEDWMETGMTDMLGKQVVDVTWRAG